MRPGGGKAKGSSFEREIARILSLWWSKGTRDDIFGRTMSSGAWGTQRAKAGKSTFGQYGEKDDKKNCQPNGPLQAGDGRHIPDEFHF